MNKITTENRKLVDFFLIKKRHNLLVISLIFDGVTLNFGKDKKNINVNFEIFLKRVKFSEKN